jgi:polysaccharide biosynthesis protein PslH
MVVQPATPRIVFASPTPPFPLDHGGSIRTHRLLTGLADAFDTCLVTFEHHPESDRPSYSQDALRALLPGVEVRTVPGLGPRDRSPSVLRRASDILSPRSSAWGPYLRLSAFRPALAEIARHRRAELVHFDYAGLGLLGPVAGCLNVYAPHNVEHRILRTRAERIPGRRRLWAELDWRKLRREERRTWRSMDLCLAVSELDAQQMRDGGARRVEVCPNGTDPVTPLPLPRREPAEPLRLVFVGMGRYEPNARGIEWFVSQVLPRIRSAIPVSLEVVGQPPPRPVQAPGVRYVGAVESLEPSYERAHVAIVPVFEGSGTRLKIPEALAYGRPIVSTSLGAEGLPVRAGTHFWQADDAPGFASAVLEAGRACEHPERRLAPMLSAGHAAIEALQWPNIVGQLIDLYGREIESRRAQLAPGRADPPRSIGADREPVPSE